MKTIIYSILLVACLFMACCSHDHEPKYESELIRIWVSAQTTVTDVSGEDGHENPIECLQVKYSPDGSWEPMMIGTIKGFEYEKGVEYELSVLRTMLSNPSVDGSTYTYRLERIISHQVVNASIHGIDSCIEIPAEGKDFDIDFTTNAPCEIVHVTGDMFGESDLLQLYDSGYGCGYSLRLNIPQNTGMGRVKLLTLSFSNGDEKEIGIWQMPGTFTESEAFELPYAGSLGYLIGTDQSNIGRIRNIRIVGNMNAHDAYYLKKILDSHNYQGYGEKPEYTVDLVHSGFVYGDKGKYSACGICDVRNEYLPSVYSNEVPSGVFTSNKYLLKVTLPEDIKAINASAFWHCESLGKINIPSSCTEIGSQAFSSCTSLTNVDFPYISHEMDLPHLQTIGEGAFSNIGRLESFVLPESLKSVATTALSFYVDRLFSLTEEPPVWEVPGNAGYVIGPKPDGCTLYVPFGCSEAYKASEKWNQFKIEEMPEDKWWEMIP
ncbi:MAG: leucine-rich repeat protein [Muribaculaceae bacterium]|nr:leucine-rich repeat protein [Muribaculaceae bacterium]